MQTPVQIDFQDMQARPDVRASIEKPGRAMLATKPLPTGSDTPTNTIETVRVSRRSAVVASVELPSRMSGRRATNSFAQRCACSGPAGAKR